MSYLIDEINNMMKVRSPYVCGLVQEPVISTNSGTIYVFLDICEGGDLKMALGKH
jgi:hypothetical protein